MKVSEIMSKKVDPIAPHLSLRSAARLMKENNLGSMLVVEDEKLVGIITDRDISVYAIAMGYGSESTEVRKVMAKEVFTCHADQEIDDAAQIMKQQHIRRLAVLNGDNTISGFLSVDDIARASQDLAGSILEAATATH